MDFASFILEHEGDDLSRLVLARERFAAQVPDFDLALTTLEVRRKLRDKVPEWYAAPGLQYPLRIAGEQCSSAQTARYKASVAASAVKGATGTAKLADLTGGLGVDSWGFAQVFGAVLYNEMRPELAAAAVHNFEALGFGNIKVQSQELVSGNLAQILDGFGPDILFLDPARRSSDGRKVFRLEDCQPDVLKLLPELLDACPRLLLKLSPMADITLVCQQLGSVKEVHVVAAEGECKELLLLLEAGYEGAYRLFVYESGIPCEILSHRACGPAQNDSNHPGSFLFEPGKALLKAGAFDWPCQFGLTKLGRHTHLYIGPEVPEGLAPFGKRFKILEMLPLNNRTIKEIAKHFPQASVTARNIPLTSDELRRKLGVKDGGTVHIFGVHADSQKANLLLICTGA